MALSVQHVHLKTRDVKQTVKYYIENFGATPKAEIPGRGQQLDLHGTQLNITGLIAEQNHEQHYGIEHMAVVTDDFPGTLDKLRSNGVAILEELTGSSGKRVAFVQAPDGAQMEVIEKA
jgi:predicted enzyme related to lactoylglutathione lyase